MAAFLLESLVLRGVAILSDGTAVNLRRGTGKAKENPEIFISMRHPLASVQVYPQPAGRLDTADSDPPAWAILGAGRSRRCAGVLVGSARNPEQAILSGWSSSRGGCLSTTAAGLGWLPTPNAAFVGEEASRHLWAPGMRSCGYGIAAVFAQAAMQCFETASWFKPASRTPPASTRGK
jgi:hypothetical protein